ncbi:Bis(5'-nucleosyl)-tetraphosphatase (asymmetrical) [Candidatus Syntrophocurvum alkaliphilum]|uniref:Bis(5'-nucleosyl)-tetraphosphatase (Asymmetrical) n=1 Tax=Candidatus Syntrophocurvum alkaliphilum TaxID=2293317 RepID=A0A6I6DGI7_9FIRM|nr:histidine triad nucleotide-binding protein [Candidatus Syntrophocurvum alkaliphilum]QGT99992.1 Bis(5'-nucleosyl)-tetraphosphatase (asymmetrical) [Candidatus Syntrophocurvum alkaliphilum]
MSESNCLFCKIISHELDAKIVYEDEQVIAIEDINPVAPVHILLIPKKHIESLDKVTEQDSVIVGNIQIIASQIAKDLKLSENGYRVVNNCGKLGGQTVYHIHYHLLGGREFGWPPG